MRTPAPTMAATRYSGALTWPPPASPPEPSEVSCADASDKDCDGLVDGADPDCYPCGDGVIQPGEECDDGNENPFDGCDRCIAVDATPN